MNNSKIIEWVLRIAVAGEFIGHGVFALQGKKDWVGWFAKFGVSNPDTATQLLLVNEITFKKLRSRRRASFTGTKFGGGESEGGQKFIPPIPFLFARPSVGFAASEARHQFRSK